MPFLSIRHRNNTSRRSRKSRTSSLPSDVPQPDQASFLTRYDALPSRSPSGHAIEYNSYVPSRYYHPPKQHPLRRSRIPNPSDSSSSAAGIGGASSTSTTDVPSDAHLNYSSSKSLPTTTQTSRRGRTSSVSSNSSTSSVVSAPMTAVPNNHPQSVTHAIRLKVAQLRRHLGRAHQLGELDMLRNAVNDHHAEIAALAERRSSLCLIIRDACLVAGLPTPSGLDGLGNHSTFSSTTATTSVSNGVPPPSASPSVTATSSSVAGSSSRMKERIVTPPHVPHPPPTTRRAAAIRSIGGRTMSALKGRAWGSRSSSNTLIVLEEPLRPNKKSTAVSSPDPSPTPLLDDPDQHPPSPSSGPGDDDTPGSQFILHGGVSNAAGALSRKSSGRLRRFGSTGTVFLRRLARAPPSTSPKAVLAANAAERDGSSASPGSTTSNGMVAVSPAISTPFDQQTLAQLGDNPGPILDGYRAALARLRAEESAAQVALATAEQKLEHRRHEHRMAMAILDHFYGTQPGWENDPIATTMFTDTVDMTEAGLQAERDLVDARRLAAQAHAAASDAELAHVSLQRASVSVAGFADALESFARGVRDGSGGVADAELAAALQELEMRLDRAVRAADVASTCCADAARVSQVRRDLGKLRESFSGEVRAVSEMGRVYRKDMMAMVGVARSAVMDCKLAEAFVRERMRLITEDVKQFAVTVEKCEEYVMMERMTLVDLHYSDRDEGRAWRGMDGD